MPFRPIVIWCSTISINKQVCQQFEQFRWDRVELQVLFGRLRPSAHLFFRLHLRKKVKEK